MTQIGKTPEKGRTEAAAEESNIADHEVLATGPRTAAPRLRGASDPARAGENIAATIHLTPLRPTAIENRGRSGRWRPRGRGAVDRHPRMRRRSGRGRDSARHPRRREGRSSGATYEPRQGGRR